jgi:hypothetical protein
VKNTSNIGSAVIGDVHGCAEELRELVEVLLETRPATRIILTGDLLTKGPDPCGVIRSIRDFRQEGVDLTSVCGNQDLRAFALLVRHSMGFKPARTSKVDQTLITRIEDEDLIPAALELLSETVDRVQTRVGAATVVHAGIRPEAGLAGTIAHDKIHLKPSGGARPWWKTYDGRDGLVVCGHRPVERPIRTGRTGRPFAVNVDTGCAGGGHLTAYIIEEDAFLSVESRQVPLRSRGGREVAPEPVCRVGQTAALAG